MTRRRIYNIITSARQSATSLRRTFAAAAASLRLPKLSAVPASVSAFVSALVLALIFISALSSCNHKDLYFDSGERYASNIKIGYALDWEQPYNNMTDWLSEWASLGLGYSYDGRRPVVPEGVRMKAFNVDGAIVETNMPATGEETYLPPGENSLLFYNNDTEFIVFNDMGSYNEASATTRSRYRPTYSGNPQYMPAGSGRVDELTVAAPDVLFGHYIDSYTQLRGAEPQQLSVTMQPLVFTYIIRYRFEEGYEHVSLARGALAGMARSVYLHNGHTSEQAVTILYDCTLEPWGVQAVVRSFGIPDFPNPSYSRGDNDFGLTLEVMTKHGNIVNFYFNVTDQLNRQPHGGVITVDGIKITDDQGGSGGSGFDVDVDEWGKFEDVDIDF